MTIITKIADETDINDIENIIYSREPKMLGVSVPKKHIDILFVNLIKFYLTQKTNKKIIIAKNELAEPLSFISMVEWLDLPVWHIANLFTKQNKNILNPNNNGLSNCLKIAFSLAEKQEKFCCYQIISKKHYIPYRQSWISYNPEISDKYVERIEEIIPANNLSKYSKFNDMISNQSWPIDLIVRSLNKIKGINYV